MKVLHISTHQTGGAALAAMRIHKALLDCGVESRVLTLDGDIENENIAKYKPLIDYSKNTKVAKIVKGLLYRLNIGMGRWWRMHDKARKGNECLYTYPVSPYRVERHPLVKWADVIHLHWCDDFINYPSFFKHINKPIVWTIHDIGIGYGGFHFKNDHDTLITYYKEIENEFRNIKEDAISKASNLTFISLSKQMKDFTQKISFIKNKNNCLIPNSVNTTVFIQREKTECRVRLGIPKDKKILLFVSEFVDTSSKGLGLLKQAIFELASKEIFLCIVGNYPKDIPKQDTVDTYYFGKITDGKKLSCIYSASDLLVVPSTEESFGQTPLESMACGTPVVVFPVGAMRDYVMKEHGVVCEECSLDALKNAIIKALTTSYDSDYIRQYVMNQYSPMKIAEIYIKVYSNSLKQ